MADERREVDRCARLLDPRQRLTDVEGGTAAVARNNRRDSHSNEVLGPRLIGKIVGMDVCL